MKATYTLLVAFDEAANVEVGQAGTFALGEGSLAYTGSAFGPGGLARVDRHRELAAGEREVRHWHIDHVLGHPASRIEAVFVTPGERIECEIHGTLPGRIVPIGASDCSCKGHVRRVDEAKTLREALAAVHERRRPG